MESLYQNSVRKLLAYYFQLIEHQKNANFSIYDETYQITLYRQEQKIVQAFKLPDKIKIYLFLYNRARVLITDELKVDKLYYELSLIAEEHNTPKLLSDKLIIQNATNNEIDPFDFLPDLSVSANSYTLFIYNEILLKKREPEEVICQEFQLLKKLDCLTDIYLLCFDSNYPENPIFHELKASGLQFLTDYLEWFHLEFQF